MKPQLVIVPAIVFVFCSLASPRLVSAQKRAQGRPEVIYDAYHDTSLPVREYSMATPQGVAREQPEHPRPRWVLSDATVKVTDRAEQTYAAPLVSATIGLNFEGMPESANGTGWEATPPDSNLAVGATQVVETVNLAWQVYNKDTGKSLFGKSAQGLTGWARPPRSLLSGGIRAPARSLFPDKLKEIRYIILANTEICDNCARLMIQYSYKYRGNYARPWLESQLSNTGSHGDPLVFACLDTR